MSSYVSITFYHSRDGELMACTETAAGRGEPYVVVGVTHDVAAAIVKILGAELPVFVDNTPVSQP